MHVQEVASLSCLHRPEAVDGVGLAWPALSLRLAPSALLQLFWARLVPWNLSSRLHGNSREDVSACSRACNLLSPKQVGMHVGAGGVEGSLFGCSPCAPRYARRPLPLSVWRELVQRGREKLAAALGRPPLLQASCASPPSCTALTFKLAARHCLSPQAACTAAKGALAAWAVRCLGGRSHPSAG